MLTLLLYVLIVGLVAALLFLVASAVFGRGEELGPLPEGTTVTVLPTENISGSDVRALRFQQVLRGYKAGEVDWALTRLAARIDDLEWQLEQVHTELAEATLGVRPGSQELPVPGDTPAPRRVSPDLTKATTTGDTPPLPEVLPGEPLPVPNTATGEDEGPGGYRPAGW